MLRRVEPLYGFAIRATDGDVGHLHDLYFDDERWLVRYLVVDTGTWLAGRQVLISPVTAEEVLWDEGRISVQLTQEQVETSPEVDLDKPVSLRQLLELNQHYDWPNYWSARMPSPGVSAVEMPSSVPPGQKFVREEVQVEEVPVDYRADSRLRSTREVVGYDLHAEDGGIGQVADFFVGTADWAIRYLLVDTGEWLRDRQVLVAPTWISNVLWPERKVHVDLTREQVKESPEYDPAKPPLRAYEEELYRHYGRPRYWD